MNQINNRYTILKKLGDRLGGIVGPAQIEKLHLVPRRVQRLTDVVQPNGRDRRVDAVGVDQGDVHRPGLLY